MEQPRLTFVKIEAFLLFYLILRFDLGTAQRLVKLQEGPLIRAEGHHITIQCNVSGMQRSQEQNFEWSITLPNRPKFQIQIISTQDPDFPYAMYKDRVVAKEIYVEKIGIDSAQLHITNLQKTDEGEYMCYTPNTDSIYWGTYSALMNLTVIPDTLSATLVPEVINKVEGDPLELVCEVSKETTVHTHVSVTWYLQKDGQNIRVISLTRDLILSAGELYKQRWALGDVQLDKVGATSYRLTIHKLQKSEQGQFYCHTTEWIQDPDKSWQELTEVQTKSTTVNVKSMGKEFIAQIKAANANINVGGSLEIACTVEAQNIAQRFFSVTWFFNNNEIVRIGPNAVLTFHGEYGTRENSGTVAVRKKTEGEYILKLYQVQVDDGGKYHCLVEESEAAATGAFSSNKTEEIEITVQRPEANLNVMITSNAIDILEGGFLQFTCNIHSEAAGHGQLSIVWQFKNKQNVKNDIIEMNRNGVQVAAEPYRERLIHGDIRMARVKSDVFTLGIYNARTSDEGLYSCKVTEWEIKSDQNWRLIGEYESSDKAVTIKSLSSNFKVTAVTRTPTAVYNGTFELQCIIRPLDLSHLPTTISWKFQPTHSNDSYHLVTFNRDTAIMWGEEGVNFKGKMIVTKTESNSVRLRVSRASKLEAGKFLCTAELWQRTHADQWVMKASATSNILQVKVKPPVSLLQLEKEVATIQKRISDITELDCRIFARTQNDSEFSVTWFFSKSRGEKEEALLNINRNNIIQYYGELHTNDEKRMKFRIEKPSNDLYQLIIEKTDVTDQGNYYCNVTEWLLDPNYIWYQVGEAASALMYVQIHTPDANLQVFDENKTVSITEGVVFELGCYIVNQTQAHSQFSVTWYFQNENDLKPSLKMLLQADRNNILQYHDSLQTDFQRLKFQSAKVSNKNYKLIIWNTAASDSGVYFCEVEEWILSPQNQWVSQGSDQSGKTTLHILTSAPTLHSKACASPSFFYFLFVYPFIIFVALMILAAYFYWNPRKPQKTPQQNSLWTPIETIIRDPKNEADASVI
ncbi:immunoglobulin superfamily member 3-like [Hypanus sabinus]|uniref:immunoglobulin superfamily member 3-like n=1 Tax=Hypanus sabinus TaxID=79690 RepID=UPI0028C44E40|nr:immunoglobulin superfamily member 3-like [Hypanus sabinus]